MDKQNKLKSEVLRLRLENAHLRNEVKRGYMRIANLNAQIEYLLFEGELRGEQDA